MRKARCVAQTMNLSQPKTCFRPNQVQKLVSADVTEPCPNFKGAYSTPKPVNVKICTKEEMKRGCPPKLCDCPQKAPPKTAGQKVCQALLFVVKSAIAAGFVYWSYSEGLWGDADQTEDLYYRAVSTIAPVLRDPPEDSDISPPHLASVKYKMVKRYNHIVFKTVGTVIALPSKIRRTFEKIVFSVDATKGEDSRTDKY